MSTSRAREGERPTCRAVPRRERHGMKDPEVAKLESYCEQLHKVIDDIRAIVWEPKTTLLQVKRKVAIVLKDVAR